MSLLVIKTFLSTCIDKFSGCSGDFLALLSSQGREDVGLAGVELHHLLGHQRVLSSGSLQLLPGLNQVGVGQHLPVLRHLLDHSLVVALKREGCLANIVIYLCVVLTSMGQLY